MSNNKQLPTELVDKMTKQIITLSEIPLPTRCAQIAIDYAEEEYVNGVLIGLKICKEMFAQGNISHENIYENEIYYKQLLKNHEDGE